MISAFTMLRAVACLRRISVALEEANDIARDRMEREAESKIVRSPKLAEVFTATYEDEEE